MARLACDRALAKTLVLELESRWLIGSPPCTAFSRRCLGLNVHTLEPAVVASGIAEGVRHLHFVISQNKIKVDDGRHCLREHPAGATSWADRWMRRLLEHRRVVPVVPGQRGYGMLTSSSTIGEPVRVRKPSR